MNKNNREDHLNTVQDNEFRIRKAYCVAGRAVAIYLNNSQKRLPEILFNIKVIDQVDKESKDLIVQDYILEGGRLLPMLPISKGLYNHKKAENIDLLALAEADIFNILVGPIAAAKYVSIIDDECFNVHLLTLKSLINYGGKGDLILIDEYQKCFWRSEEEGSKKLTEIFHQAFHFVSEQSKWLIIKTIAHNIFEQKPPSMDYQEIVSIIERADCLNQVEQMNLTNLWRLKNNG